MKALVTGAGGFCGRHLTRFLAERSVEVHTLGTRAPSGPHEHHLIGDVTDTDALSSVLATVRPDYLFHLAGTTDVRDLGSLYRVNCGFGGALLGALKRQKTLSCPVLLVGTSAEYGMIGAEDLPLDETHPARPYSHYGASKLAQSLAGLVEAGEGLPVVVVRPFNIVGPGMPAHLVLGSFAAQVVAIRQGRRPPVVETGNLEPSRDFVGAPDAIRAYWALVNNPQAFGGVVNVCSGRATRIGDLLAALIDASGLPIEVRQAPGLVKRLDVPAHYGDTAKLFRLAGFVPGFDLSRTVHEVLSAEEAACAAR